MKNEENKKGVLELDANTTLLAQLDVLTKHLARDTFVYANVSQVQALQCDFYGHGHAYSNCVLEVTKEVQYVNKFPRGNHYSNTYNPG